MIKAGLVGSGVSSYLNRSWDEKGNTVISHIFVSYNECITSIQFGYLKNGSLVLSQVYGSSGKSFRVVKLKQDEYVTGLSGTIKVNEGIRNLTFHTNRGKHGTGFSSDDADTRFTKIEIDPAISDRCEFGGFFGTFENYTNLVSIGIYLNPIASSHTVVKREIR